jgi:amidase
MTPTPPPPASPDVRDASTFPIDDTVGAWTPHGRFAGAAATPGSLSGLRFTAKGLFDVAGHPTGAGNPAWLATHEPAREDAPLVAAPSAAGATLCGKVLTDELACSLHGANAHYGTPVNARAPERVCGGSSSGSASAVAAGLVDVALGTDTGGSTRVPASDCGLWGLRPTHGRLSVDGLVPLCPSFDTPTWLADDPSVFGRVADVLLGETDRDPHAAGWTPRRVLRLDDGRALAEPAFAGPLTRAQSVLAALRGAPAATVRTTADGASLDDWRRADATVSSHEGWSVHGGWIERHHPRFGDAIAGRWDMARRIPAAEAAAARAVLATIRARVRARLRRRRVHRRRDPRAHAGDHLHRGDRRAAAGEPALARRGRRRADRRVAARAARHGPRWSRWPRGCAPRSADRVPGAGARTHALRAAGASSARCPAASPPSPTPSSVATSPARRSRWWAASPTTSRWRGSRSASPARSRCSASWAARSSRRRCSSRRSRASSPTATRSDEC